MAAPMLLANLIRGAGRLRAVTFLAAVGVACASRPPTAEPASLAEVVPDASAEAANALADRIVDAIRTGSFDAYVQAYDREQAIADTYAGAQVSEAELGAIRPALDDAQHNWFGLFVDFERRGGRLRPLPSVDIEQDRWARVGGIGVDGGFAQWRFRAVEVDGRTFFTDVWDLESGVRRSDATRALFDRIKAGPQSRDAVLAEVEALQAFREVGLVEGPEALLNAWGALPPAIRATREAHIIRLSAAQLVPGTPSRVFREILDDFAAANPGDPALAHREMDVRALAGDPMGAARAAEDLHQIWGPDAAILLVASVHYERAGDLDAARDAADRAVRLEPELEEARRRVASLAQKP